jgi:phage FluMu protein Com
MTERKQAICYTCGANFGYDWVAWAKHTLEKISENKKDIAHKKGKLFAHKILINAKKLNQKRDLNGRVPLTEQEKENKVSTRRETSGIFNYILAICPNCKTRHRMKVEEEFTTDEFTWKAKESHFVLCENCRFTR